MRKIICDTNIWYHIAFGEINVSSYKDLGDILIATPINFLEIVSKVEEGNFETRKKVAKAVLDNADEFIVDTEKYLCEIWGLSVNPVNKIDWKELFSMFVSMNSFSDLKNGINKNGVSIRFDGQFVTAWRLHHWIDFKDQVIKIIDDFLPGYALARVNKNSIHMSKDLGDAFKQSIQSTNVTYQITIATWCRALLEQGNLDQTIGSKERYASASQKLKCYLDCYKQYIYKCATVFCPEDNDWGDMECLLYAHDDYYIFTREDRWIKILKETGNDSLLIRG